MIFRSEILEVTSLLWFKLAAGFTLSFFVTLVGIPSVVKISNIKGLYDMPGSRTSHYIPTPRLGGAMIFAGVIISSILLSVFGSAYELNCIVAGLIILFFIGLKDDIISLVPLKKATGQLIASLIIVILGDIRLKFCDTLFEPLFLAYLADVFLSVLIVMTLINSINLIDGIDGLASGVGIIGSLTFGIWYTINDNSSYALMCFSLAGSLFSFSWYNVFSRKYKIFLGDTGSMIIGFLLSVFVIRFLASNAGIPSAGKLASAPAIALAVLIVPIFDTIRICIVRLAHGKSILIGDNNHLHHSVLRISGSHAKATTVILSVNIILILLTYFARNIGNLLLVLFLLIIESCISVSLHFYLKRHS